MANQAFTKVSAVAKQIDNLTISNNLRVGGTTIAGPIEKTLIIPTATAAPSDSLNNIIRLTPQQSGTTFILTQNVGGFDQILVLPPAAIGLNYTFIVQNATNGSTISIMPYGYATTGGNPATTNGIDTNGVAEAFPFGIQAIIDIGGANSGVYDVGEVSEQVNTLNGSVAAGGIMFTNPTAAPATLKLTCISTSILGTVVAGCRWLGDGRAAGAQDIDISA